MATYTLMSLSYFTCNITTQLLWHCGAELMMHCRLLYRAYNRACKVMVRVHNSNQTLSQPFNVKTPQKAAKFVEMSWISGEKAA